mmetsp:Transcript_26435/g.78193  ORF Transcript_26435/g.78193 Transcript_26435/m.78193 type:complete len:284 (-) Transcript_26435:131-982(-)
MRRDVLQRHKRRVQHRPRLGRHRVRMHDLRCATLGRDDCGAFEEQGAVSAAENGQGVAERGGVVTRAHHLVHRVTHNRRPRQSHVPPTLGLAVHVTRREHAREPLRSLLLVLGREGDAFVARREHKVAQALCRRGGEAAIDSDHAGPIDTAGMAVLARRHRVQRQRTIVLAAEGAPLRPRALGRVAARPLRRAACEGLPRSHEDALLLAGRVRTTKVGEQKLVEGAASRGEEVVNEGRRSWRRLLEEELHRAHRLRAISVAGAPFRRAIGGGLAIGGLGGAES